MRSAIWLLTLLMLARCASSPPEMSGPTRAERPRIKVGDTLNCNKLVNYVKPVYPREVKRRPIQATVSLRAVITKTGELRDFEVLKGDPLLVPAALSAARQWRYTPCLLNGEAVDVITVIDIDFTKNQ